ncbi:MAG: iron chelate uptake ABC transporter family permease subunit [Paraglaciecola sp.]|uniref:ABC transporter permease n=1 Tax=Paraglaciecola sp. TaxID=1920173 RepID=UPI0032988205
MVYALLCLFMLCLASLLLGAKYTSVTQFLTFSDDAWLVFSASRLPRLFALICSGVGLAVCGVILQQIVQNRFVEPATCGGLDAAKLGILISIIYAPSMGMTARMIGALIFCIFACCIFTLVIRSIRYKSPVLVPVIGIMFGGVLSAIAELYAYQNNMMQNMQGWMLGDFSKIVQGNYEIIYLILPVVILTYFYAQRLTIVGMGEGLATTLGLSYFNIVALGLILVSLTIATTVITVGSIPFIGLIIPNLVAMRYGDNLKRTLPIIAFAGAVLLIVCDLLGRLIIYPFEIPIGITASCLGGLMFLAVVWKIR